MNETIETAAGLIKNTFTPQIAVITSTEAEKCCQKNNLHFVELLQPFSRLNTDVHFKDQQGVNNAVKHLKLNFLDVNSRPPQTVIARKLLNLAVSETSDPKYQIVHVGNRQLEIPLTTSWFAQWRETFLKVQYPSDHEFTKHFLACILVASSSDVNPLETLIQLAQNVNQMCSYSNQPEKLPKWFSTNVLKYYVILHDNNNGNFSIAMEVFESIKSTYGQANCFLLRMNSRPPGPEEQFEQTADPWAQFLQNPIETNADSPNVSDNIFELAEEANEVKTMFEDKQTYHPLSPVSDITPSTEKLKNSAEQGSKNNLKVRHGLFLSTEDLENIKSFVFEFTKNSLIPYVEKQIQVLSENISNKKGMSRSLLTATKRWLNPNKPGANSKSVNLIYAPDSMELQLRRLGDLYFMFGSFNNAYQAYNMAKKDFNADQAWLYYAGALEMAALSAFITSESNKRSYELLEESITTYLTSCKLPQFATRATLLGSECLKQQNQFSEAAIQLIRMTSEDSDLRSALLLEQASYCFLKSKMVRKYAFHMVLAGHRYFKSAQRKHSLRSYKQAFQVFKDNGWNLACDHIYFSMGRQANSLNLFEEAVISYSKLLLGESKQPPAQQITFLKEYLLVQNKLIETNEIKIPLLPIPLFNFSTLKVLLEPPPPLKTPGTVSAIGVNFSENSNQISEDKWHKLEEMLVQEAQGSLPMIFKPMITLFKEDRLYSATPNAIINEPIQISLQVFNQLQIDINLSDVYLLWNFKHENEDVVLQHISDTDTEKYVKTHVLEALHLEPINKSDVVLLLTPLSIGELTITGICYTLNAGGNTEEKISITGKQLLNIPIKNDKMNSKQLKINVVPPASCLQVTFSEINSNILCGEMQKITVNFQNTGSIPLHNIHWATTDPEILTSEFNNKIYTTNLDNVETAAAKDKLIRKNHVTYVPLSSNSLVPGQTVSFSLWLKAPPTKGIYSVALLIYYENMNSNSIPRYRLVRQNWDLSVIDSVKLQINTLESGNSKDVQEISLSLKLNNANAIYNTTLVEITLTQIGLLSKYWELLKAGSLANDFNLNSQEGAYILLKARRIKSIESRSTNLILLKNESYIDGIQNAFKQFCKKSEQKPINYFYPLDDDCNKHLKNGILFVQWHAVIQETKTKRNAIGQSYIPIDFQPNKSNLNGNENYYGPDIPLSLDNSDIKLRNYEMEQMKTQIVYNLDFPVNVNHDFKKHKICLVPVKLFLHSVVDKQPLYLLVKTLGISSHPVLQSMIYPNASSYFKWVGSGVILKKIEPLTTESLNLNVAVFGPGTFDIGSHIEIYCGNTSEIGRAHV